MFKGNWILYIGDTLAIAIITLLGFITHNEAGLTFLPRMAAVFFPLLIAWLLFSHWLGLYQREIVSNPKQLWRPVLAMLMTAPLAALFRGLILSAPIVPIFVIVLSAASILGIVLWRTGWYWITQISGS